MLTQGLYVDSKDLCIFRDGIISHINSSGILEVIRYTAIVGLTNTDKIEKIDMAEIAKITKLITDPLSFKDDGIQEVSVFEFSKYKHPFTLWEIDDYDEPDGIFQPIHSSIKVTTEQDKLLTAMQAEFSRDIIKACADYIFFYHDCPRPQKQVKLKNEHQIKGLHNLHLRKKKLTPDQADEIKHALVNHTCKNPFLHWKQLFNYLSGHLKSALIEKGWPGRLANAILQIAKRELMMAKRRFKLNPSNHTHNKVMHWGSKKGYNHVCLGDKKALMDIQKAQVNIQELESFLDYTLVPDLSKAEELRIDAETDLIVERQLKEKAQAKWAESRIYPITCVGGTDEVPWMNKTIFLRSVLASQEPDACELVVKLPKFLFPGWVEQNGDRKLPKIVIPARVEDRSLKLWRKAIKAKKCLTFTLMPQRSGVWRLTGVYKEACAPKVKSLRGKRLGVDQNAGFITVACVDGRKIKWVRKFHISQSGSTEEHEARIGAVMKALCEMAKLERADIIIEDLRLASKHKHFCTKKVRRHIQRIPYRKLQVILGRECSRQGVTMRQVNPAYTSILGRYRLPGMQVHLAAAAMIAWRDIGYDNMEIFQIGTNSLKVRGEDSPIVIEVVEGIQLVRSMCNKSDPRFFADLYKLVRSVSRKGAVRTAKATTAHDSQRHEESGRITLTGDSSLLTHLHEGETLGESPGRRTCHDQKHPAAGASPTKVRVIIRLKPTPRKNKNRLNQSHNTVFTA